MRKKPEETKDTEDIEDTGRKRRTEMIQDIAPKKFHNEYHPEIRP